MRVQQTVQQHAATPGCTIAELENLLAGHCGQTAVDLPPKALTVCLVRKGMASPVRPAHNPEMEAATVVGVIVYTAVIITLAAHKEPAWVDRLFAQLVEPLRRKR